MRLVSDRRDLPADHAAATLQNRAAWRTTGRRERQLDLDPRRILDHVRVGDDVAVRIDDHPGAAAAFELRFTGGRAILLVGAAVAGDEYLHDPRTHAGGEGLQ